MESNFRIERRAGKLYLFFPYAPDVVAKVRDIPGARFNEPFKAWTFPATAVCYNAIKNATGASEVAIEAWLKKRQRAFALSSWQFKTTPMKHQAEAIEMLLKKFGVQIKK